MTESPDASGAPADTRPAPPPPPLHPLPPQPAGVRWPTDEWPEADPSEAGADGARLADLLDELLDGEHPVLGRTHGAAVVAGGRLVAERYGERVVQDLRAMGDDPPHEPVTAETGLLSWSMAKSITSLAVGVAVGDGALRVDDPVGDPRWAATPGDPRAAITWADLLTMRPGLAWTEAYYGFEAEALPDVVTMLYGPESADMAAFAAGFDLVHEPGSAAAYCYSSGTTNIVAANLQRVLGLDRDGMDRFLRERIFGPVGMASATPSFDDAGTFVASSYLHATLRDWCRFGLLALRGGCWDGVDVVPTGWVDWSRTARSWDDPVWHGAQWWAWDRADGPFGAHGFEGQRVIGFPTRDLVVVRLGRMPAEETAPLNDFLGRIAECFPEVSGPGA